jgi:hypothetical protein
MLLVTLGGLFVALGLPMAKRWVPRNRWYGLRTPQTLGDDRIWYPANARSGVDFIILGAIAIVVGIGLRMTPLPEKQQVTAGGTIIVAGALLVAVRGFLHARKLAREIAH